VQGIDRSDPLGSESNRPTNGATMTDPTRALECIAWHADRARSATTERKRFAVRMAHLRAQLAHTGLRGLHVAIRAGRVA